MSLSDFKRKDLKLKPGTLAFLIEEDRILLAYKKRGFGVGKWNGVGGKIKQSESIEEAFLREVREEIGVEATDCKKMATLHFYDPHIVANNFLVHVYFVKSWNGDIVESEEVRPEWFDLSDIPYENMWPDDVHWLPEVLSEKMIEGHFLFGKDTEIVEYEVIYIK